MKTISKFLFICLFLLIIFSLLQCSRKPVSDCNSKKIEMLVDNVFKKLYVPVFIYLKPYIQGPADALNWNDNSEDDSLSLVLPYSIIYLSDTYDFTRAGKVQDDSIRYFLYSTTIKLPDKDYYLYYRNKNKKVDSIKLNKIYDHSQASEYNCTIYMDFLEVNSDTTKIKIVAGYGIVNRAGTEITNTDTFDVQNCKWIVLDSTIWED